MRKQGKIRISLLLAFVIVFAAVGIVRADSLDLSREMSLTVEMQDTNAGQLCYDLYKIADIESPMFGFAVTEDYGALSELLGEASSLIGEDADSADWNDVAQQAMTMTFGEVGSLVDESQLTQAAYTGLTMNTSNSVAAGLYLLVTRNTEADSTVLTSLTQEDGTEQLASYTLIDTHTYAFLPQLVCLPTKEGGSSISSGDWQYEQTIELKWSVDPATGSIVIDKSLTGYYGDAEKAVFVFQVDTYYPTADELYSSEIYSLEFTGAGEQTLRIDGIPIGAQVLVSEVYSGVNYCMASITYPGDNNYAVVTEQPQTIYVSNEYNGNTSGGGGVTNHFTYEAKEDGTMAWSWSQENGNAATSNGIADKLLEQIIEMSRTHND